MEDPEEPLINVDAMDVSAAQILFSTKSCKVGAEAPGRWPCFAMAGLGVRGWRYDA